jgi:hypothetical protein
MTHHILQPIAFTFHRSINQLEEVGFFTEDGTLYVSAWHIAEAACRWYRRGARNDEGYRLMTPTMIVVFDILETSADNVLDVLRDAFRTLYIFDYITLDVESMWLGVIERSKG